MVDEPAVTGGGDCKARKDYDLIETEIRKLVDDMTKTFLISSALIAVTLLPACTAPYKMEDAQYWGRKNATSALYLRGPKAQQNLHMDIATCVNEISELERMGAIRNAMPADTKDGRVPDPKTPEGKMAKWDSPKRDGYLYNEHLPYTDFETCMDAKGWERIESLPYGQSDIARGDYLRNVRGYDYQSKNNVNRYESNAPANSYQAAPDTVINE